MTAPHGVPNEEAPDRRHGAGAEKGEWQGNHSSLGYHETGHNVNSILDAALELAAEGIPVFPCRPDNKAPLTTNGFKAATTDQDQIREWWAQQPGAMIGLPTGPITGVWCLDIDLKTDADGFASLAALTAKYGPLPATRTHKTGGGGQHLLFKHPAGRIVSNTVNKLSPGLDTRGDGGYIIVPPSVNAAGGAYTIEDARPPVDAPDWLLDFVTPLPKAEPPRQAVQFNGSGHPWIKAGLEAACNNLAGMAKGRRNATLNETAFRFLRFTIGGYIDADNVENALLNAAFACGLPEGEAGKTIASAKAAARNAGPLHPPEPAPSGQKTLQAAALQSWPPRGEEAVSWPEPVPFDGLSLPTLDTSRFSPILRSFIEATAESLQVPVELVFANAIGVGAACLQGKAHVRIHEDYAESLNLYLLAALLPAERKSPTVERCKIPLVEWEDKAFLKYRDICQKSKSERLSKERIIEGRRARLSKANPDENQAAEIEAIRKLESELPEVPVIPRLLIDDITPEATADMLSKHGERLSIIEPEGGLFDILAGLYSNGAANIDVYLKAWSGEPVTIDRKHGDPIRLRNPLLTICLSPQPEVIAKLASNSGFRGRGLLGRFLYFLPQSLVGYRKVNTGPIPKTIFANYAGKIRSLLNLKLADGGRANDIRLTPEAEQTRLALAQHIETKMRPGEELAHIRDWAGKLVGNTTRLAGVLHFFKHDDGLATKIDNETMQCAAYLAGVMVDHARAAFGLMGADPDIECAKTIAEWIARPRPEPLEQFTGRDCFNSLRGRFQKMPEINAGLNILEERFFIRKITERAVKVGRPTQLYQVNPALFGGAK